jgi:hypothetical protein
MSYDLFVFDPEQAPQDREGFNAWYEEQSSHEEAHSYDDPAVSAPQLRAWFMDMIQTFPALNGPFASNELPEDESSVTDYSIGQSLIYACFRWSKAEQAHEAVFNLAAKHGVGFCDASSDRGEVWLPDGIGGLSLAHSAP